MAIVGEKTTEMPPSPRTSQRRVRVSGAALDRLTARTITSPLPRYQKPATDPKLVAALGELGKNSKSSLDATRFGQTQERRRAADEARRRDRDKLARGRQEREVLSILEQIKRGINRMAAGAQGGLADSFLDFIGHKGLRPNRVGMTSGTRYRNKLTGRYTARPRSFMGRAAAHLGLGETAVAATSTVGRLGRVGRLAGRVLGKVALPVTAGLALADGFNGIRHADDIMGRKTGNTEKIGVGVSEAINGALLGIPDWISKKVFGVSFTKGVVNLVENVGAQTLKVLSDPMQVVSKVFSGASSTLTSWLGTVKGAVDDLVDSIKNRRWGEVPGKVATVLKYTTPVGLAVSAGEYAVKHAPEPVRAAAQNVSDTARSATTAAVNVTRETVSTVSGWLGLGDTSKKYESGRGGAGTVSSGKGDPGGASYGTYQLASKTGTLDKFLRSSGYGSQFNGLKPGTEAFNKKWKEIAKSDSNFGTAQHDFIKRTHYDPAAKYAQSLGFDVNDKGIADAIWSASVQHGGVKKILKQAASSPGWAQLDNKGKIKRLYDVRASYATTQMAKNGASSQQIASVSKRYTREVNDALALSGQSVPAVSLAKSPATTGTTPAITVSKTMAEAKTPTNSKPINKPVVVGAPSVPQDTNGTTPTITVPQTQTGAKTPTSSKPVGQVAPVATLHLDTVTHAAAAALVPQARTARSEPISVKALGLQRPSTVATTPVVGKSQPVTVMQPMPQPKSQPVVSSAPPMTAQASQTNGSMKASNTKPPEAKQSSSGNLPPLDAIPTQPSMELLAIASLLHM